jgi:hypothetical protein
VVLRLSGVALTACGGREVVLGAEAAPAGGSV